MLAGLKESTPGSVLVDAGDATQGLPLASLTKGADVIELMNLAGYDLMTAGNHEFDFGTEQFLANAALADFPVLAANIYRDGKLLLEGQQGENKGCHVVIEREGMKIGFFGLTTSRTATSTNPAGISDLEFRDEVETAKHEIDELEEEHVDVIVAVCHLGDETADVPCSSTRLAEAMTGEYQDKIDVMIDGHSHTLDNENVNGILVVQAGTGMENVGKLTLKAENGNVTATEELLDAEDLADVTPDAKVTAKLSEIQDSQTELLKQEIGTLETTLWAGQIGIVAVARVAETNYGDFTADAFRKAGEEMLEVTEPDGTSLPVVAVENAGGIRAAMPNGTVTMENLVEAFPFSNTLYMKKVTPQILYEMMEISGAELDGQDRETGMLLQGSNSGGFLQISGFTVVFDPDGEAGRRVTSIVLDGQTEPLDREDDATEIMLVSNNYIMSGGSGYTMLADLPQYAEAGGELETIQNYLESCLSDGSLQEYAGTQNRIQMRGEGYVPKDYTALIRITDEDGNSLAGKELSYRVDGAARQNGVTDAEGFLHITVSDGAHGVRLSDSRQEVYVDNYTGFGIVEDQYREYPTLTFLADGSCDPVTEGGAQPETPSDTEEPSDVQEPEYIGNPEEPEPVRETEVIAPETGDTSAAGGYAVLAVGALAAAAAVSSRWRKSSEKR